MTINISMVLLALFATQIAVLHAACSDSANQVECSACRWPSNFFGVWCWTDDAKSVGTCVESTPNDGIMASYANCWHLEGGLQFMNPYISSPTVSLPNLRSAVKIVWGENVPGTNAFPQLRQVDSLSIHLREAATFDNFRTVKVVKDLILTCAHHPLTSFGTAFDETIEMSRIMIEFCEDLADISGFRNLERMVPLDGAYSSITLNGLPIADLSAFAKLQNVDQLALVSLSNLAPNAFSALVQLQPPTMRFELTQLPVTSLDFPAFPTTPQSWQIIDPMFGGKLILKELPGVTSLASLAGLSYVDELEIQSLSPTVDLSALSALTTCMMRLSNLGVTNLDFTANMNFSHVQGYGGCGIEISYMPDLSSIEALRVPITQSAARLTGNVAFGFLPSLSDLSPVTDTIERGAIQLMDLPLVTEAIFRKLVHAEDVMIWVDSLETLAFPALESVGPNMMVYSMSVNRAYIAPGVSLESSSGYLYYEFMLPMLCCANMQRLVEAFGLPSMDPDGMSGSMEGCSASETCHCYPHPAPLHGSLPSPFDDLYGAPAQSILCDAGYYLQGTAQVCAIDGKWNGPPQSCEACPPGAATCDATDVFTCLSGALPEDGFCCNNGGLSCADSNMLSCVAHNGTCVPCESDEYFASGSNTCEDCPLGAASCNATHVLSCLDSAEPENGFCCNNGGESCAASHMLSCINHNGACVPCASDEYYRSDTATCEACPAGAATCNATHALTCLNAALPENGFCCNNGGLSCAESNMLSCVAHDGTCVPCASDEYFRSDTKACEACPAGAATCNATHVLTCLSFALPENGFCCNNGGELCAASHMLSCINHNGACVPCASDEYFASETQICEDCGTAVATCHNASVAVSCTAGHLPTSNGSAVLCCLTDTACETLQRFSCAAHGEPCGAVIPSESEASSSSTESSTAAPSSSTGPSSSSSSTGTTPSAGFPLVTAAEMQARPLVLGALRLVVPLEGNIHDVQYLLNVTRSLAQAMDVPLERVQVIGLLTAEDGTTALAFDLLPGTGPSNAEVFARLQAQEPRARPYDTAWGVTPPSRLSILYICLIAAACVIVGTTVVIAVCWTRRRRRVASIETVHCKPPTPSQRIPTEASETTDVVVVLPVRSNNYMA